MCSVFWLALEGAVSAVVVCWEGFHEHVLLELTGMEELYQGAFDV